MRRSPRTPIPATGGRTSAPRGRPAAAARRRASAAPRQAAAPMGVRLQSSVADPGIEPGGRHVDEDVQHDEHHRVEENQVLHYKNVALVDCGEHCETKPGGAEGTL